MKGPVAKLANNRLGKILYWLRLSKFTYNFNLLCNPTAIIFSHMFNSTIKNAYLKPPSAPIDLHKIDFQFIP